MKIGILGGSFNPAHQGHIHISLQAIKKLNLDQVWWIPTQYNPFKDKSKYLSHQQRLKDCQIFVKNYPKIYVKNFAEIYTIKLIKRLQINSRGHEFVWIMGADNFENFHRWKNFSQLIMLLPIAIFSRDDYLAKIRKTKAWQIYQSKKIMRFSPSDCLQKDNVLSGISRRNKYSKSSCSEKLLPNFITINSKKLLISSTQIRNKTYE